MKEEAHKKILTTIKCEPSLDYLGWKTKRDFAIKLVGQCYTLFTENDLISIFQQWESMIMSCEDTEKREEKLQNLLLISLLHYFVRSFSLLKLHFKLILLAISSEDRDICKITGKILKNITTESTENSSFLRRALNLATAFLSPKNRSTMVYNAMVVLRQVGRFMPTESTTITIRHQPEIFNATVSHDIELSTIASKVLEIHLASIPKHTSAVVADSLLLDYISLFSHPEEVSVGVITAVDVIFKMFDGVSRLNSLVESLITFAKHPKSDASVAALNLLVRITKKHPELIGNSINQAIMLIISSTIESDFSEHYVKFLSKLIEVIPPKKVPINDLIQMIRFRIESSKTEEKADPAYKILKVLLKARPDIKLSINDFPFYTRHSLEVLHLQPHLVEQAKEPLLNIFGIGVSPRSTVEEQKLALLVVVYFLNEVLGEIPAVKELINRFTYSQSRSVRLLIVDAFASMHTAEANTGLVRMAVMDYDKGVRLKALSLLDGNDEAIAMNASLLVESLGDQSYKVRRAAIPLIGRGAELKCIEIFPVVRVFMSDFISQNVKAGKPKRVARTSSLLPSAAKYFARFDQTLGLQILELCLVLLYKGEIPENANGYMNIREQISRNGYDLKNKPEEESIAKTIGTVFNAQWIDIRDTHLYDTLTELSIALPELIPQFITQIVPAIVKGFDWQRSEDVNISALNALYRIVTADEMKTNVLKMFPELYESISELLGKGCVQEVAVECFRVLGSIGATKVSQSRSENEEIYEPLDTSNNSYYTEFVLREIFELEDLGPPTPSMIEAVLGIYVHETEGVLPFLGQTVNMFLRALNGTKNDKSRLFSQLEIIVWKVGVYFEPFVDQIGDILFDNFQNESCLLLIIRLSKVLVSDFTKVMRRLYQEALRQFGMIKGEYFRTLLRVISFGIIYQKQSLSQYLDVVEAYFDESEGLERVDIAFIFRSISTIVQNSSSVVYSSRIARLCFRMLPVQELHEIQQLVYNLCLFGDLPIEIVRPVNIPRLNEVADAIENKKANIESLRFVKPIEPYVSNDHLRNFIPELPSSNQNVFANIKQPTYNSSLQWINDFCMKCVENSPSQSIMFCKNVLAQSHSFRERLYPIAFVSCWKCASIRDKESFSNIVGMMLENFEEIDQFVINFIEQIDKLGFPLLISDKTIASVCESTAHMIYLLEREYMKNRDKDTRTDLIKLYSKMGEQNSARGVFESDSESKMMKSEESGRWLVSLGEWEKALKFYESDKDKIGMIKCCGHLEKWNQIREFAEDYDKMHLNKKKETALWFAMAFYHSKEYERCESFLNDIEKNDIKALLFKSIYYIDVERYEEAEQCIIDSFKLLTEERSNFKGSDIGKAMRNLVYAQHLVEVIEALEVKTGRRGSVEIIWRNRLENLSFESGAWMELAGIRSLVAGPPEEHTESHHKVLSVLRQERRWELTEAYCSKYFPGETPLSVLVEELKIMGERGERGRAVSIIKAINRMYSGHFDGIDRNTEIFLLKKFGAQKLDEASFNKYMEKNDIDRFKRARLLRLQGTWEYAMYSSARSEPESLVGICEIFRASQELGDDARTWTWWAQAAGRALPHLPELRERLAGEAITGFIKASKLNPENSLGLLCQMFSIFFRYNSGSVSKEKLKSELEELGSKILSDTVPQIVVHIAHSDLSIRKTVQSIIVNFGFSHFEAVIYSLNVLSLIEDEDKAMVAKEIMEKIGNEHSTIYKEAKLFIDGMHRSAVSWLEEWTSKLDMASRFNSSGDREGVIKNINRLYSEFSKPQCEMDRSFVRYFGASMQRCKAWFERFKKGGSAASKPMWDSFKSLFFEIDIKMKRIESFQLETISEELSQKRGFSLSIPGTYQVNDTNTKHQLYRIDPILTVLKTQQHPRCVYMEDSEGNRWKFLLKGNEDLRVDQRIIQFFMLVNSLLRNNRTTSRLGVSIANYSIIPFAPNAGLISWVEGSDTFQQLVLDYRSSREPQNPNESEISASICGPNFNALNSIQRLEVFESVSELTPANELREILWVKSPSATVWLSRRRRFIVSTALMSIAGYVVGLGDRHPSNIMIQRHTGKVIHIDFGDSFEVAMKRSAFPERVPFRLTRMIVNGLDGMAPEGLFRRVCEDVLWVVRRAHGVVVALLEVFVHEPIFCAKEPVRVGGSDGPSGRRRRDVLTRVSEKLLGTDGIDLECPGGERTEGRENKGKRERGVREQVEWLIGVASNPAEYVRHYVGWCPFW